MPLFSYWAVVFYFILLLQQCTLLPNDVRFFVQDDGDGNGATSDGIFIYQGSTPSVAVGDLVTVTGEASDYFYNTQIRVFSVETDIVSLCQASNRRAGQTLETQRGHSTKSLRHCTNGLRTK